MLKLALDLGAFIACCALLWFVIYLLLRQRLVPWLCRVGGKLRRYPLHLALSIVLGAAAGTTCATVGVFLLLYCLGYAPNATKTPKEL